MNKLSQFKQHVIEPDKPRKEPQTAESVLQAKCVADMRSYYPETNGLFFAIDNNSADAFVGALKKAIGVTEGVSDTVYLEDFGQVHWIEFKKPIPGSKQSKGQIKWQAKIEAKGHRYSVCKDYHHFWTLVGLPCPEPNFVFTHK